MFCSFITINTLIIRKKAVHLLKTDIYRENTDRMAKKIIKLTEKKLRRIITGVIHEELFRINEESNVFPSSDDVFDLDNISMDILDKSYVRYEPYNLGITYRHPLRRINEEIDYRKHIEEAKKVILSTYPLSEEQFIIMEGHNGMYAAILASLVENNVEIIEQSMLKLGFFRSKPTDEKLLCDKKNRKWVDLRFEPIKSNDLTDFVRDNYPYVYHLAPSIFENSIRQKGLIPSNANSEFKYYEPRVYVMKGGATPSAVQELVNELYQQAKGKGFENLSPNYSLFTIDVKSIDRNVRFTAI